jgi:hypothetical protein
LDLRTLDADDAPFARYVTLANEANRKGCGYALDAERAALTKLVNSISLSASLTPPLAIDAAEALYRVDLRDYDWDRSIELNGVAFRDAWEALIASIPSAVPFVGDAADSAVEDSGTAVPVLFGDALIATASFGDVYYALLGVPDNLDDFLLDDLGAISLRREPTMTSSAPASPAAAWSSSPNARRWRCGRVSSGT